MSKSKGETKSQTRQRVKADRLELSEAQIEKISTAIAKRVIDEIDWTKVKALHSFLPIKSLNEVDTFMILRELWEHWPEVTTYAFADAETTETIDATTALAENARGIPEPVGGLVGETDFDIILVPLLAFDGQGNRLGYGEGHYDRFLVRHTQALRIGLGLELGRVDELPHEPHDQRLNLVVTEKQIYRFE